MNRACWIWPALIASVLGCTSKRPTCRPNDELAHYKYVATQIEYPDVQVCSSEAAIGSLAPRTLRSNVPPQFWDISLEEAIQTALANAAVMRDLGGLVVQAPGNVQSAYGPAIQETDPRFGVDAALGAFDAEFAVSTFWEKNDRAINNTFFGGGTRLLQQDLGVFQAQLSKRAATGTQFAVRNNTDYDANTAPGNQFPSAWNTNFEIEARHPFLQGGGMEFNRIAGPFATPGVYNGVLIARINTDVRLAELEEGVRRLVSDVENAYWDLYFAYRDLEAKVNARDAALETWRRINALYIAQRAGGEAEKEAQAREQYYFFQAEVENALSGRPVDGTLSGQGSAGGTFRGTEGVYVREIRLRRMMGLAVNDGRLIRPADEPSKAIVVFEWDEILMEALERRVELRKQLWQIKRRELELVAARNFLLPRLDGVSRYRWRAFGDHLIDPDGNNGRFDNAFEDLTTGDFQEWQLGFQLTAPLGYRRGHAAVRNAQLQLARERALLREQELQVAHDLGSAITELDRAFVVTQTNFNRRVAALQQVAAVQAAYEADNASLELLLEAQRRLAAADSLYHRSLVEYTMAIKNVHFEKGSLLDYNQIYMTEGPWPGKAYRDAANREQQRRPMRPMSYVITCPGVITRPGGGPPLHESGAVVQVVPLNQAEGVPAPLDGNPADGQLPPANEPPIEPNPPAFSGVSAPSPSAGSALEEPNPLRLPVEPMELAERPQPPQIQIPFCWLRCR